MRGFRFGTIGALAAISAGMLGAAIPLPVQRETLPESPRRRRRSFKGYVQASTRTTYQDRTGDRERARRWRQIQRGQLKAENGLVVS